MDLNADSKQKKENQNSDKGDNKSKKDTPNNSMIEEGDGIRAIGGA